MAYDIAHLTELIHYHVVLGEATNAAADAKLAELVRNIEGLSTTPLFRAAEWMACEGCGAWVDTDLIGPDGAGIVGDGGFYCSSFVGTVRTEIGRRGWSPGGQLRVPCEGGCTRTGGGIPAAHPGLSVGRVRAVRGVAVLHRRLRAGPQYGDRGNAACGARLRTPLCRTGDGCD